MEKIMNQATALLLVDIQKDYFKGGAFELTHTEEALEAVEKALKVFRASGHTVIHVRHISNKENAQFFLPDTEGSEIHDALTPEQEEPVVIKHMPNSFKDTNLKEVLDSRKIKRLVIAGMMSHHCVDSTVRAASEMGYECLVLADGCATRGLPWQGKMIPAETVHQAFMAGLQGFAKVINVNDLLQ